MMKVYKKSYLGFWLWMLGFCLACTGCIFLPEMDVQIILAIIDNIMTIGVFILTLIIYLTECIYWYNGTSFEAAAAAGSVRRKRFAFAHMKRFGLFALVFLLYNVLSIVIGIPWGVDIAVVLVGIVGVALSTLKIKL